MKVQIKDRLIIQKDIISAMPEYGGFVEMMHKSDLIEQTKITMAEIRKFNFADDGKGGVTWEASPKSVKNLDLTRKQVEMLKLAVQLLEQRGLMNTEIEDLCQRILQW